MKPVGLAAEAAATETQLTANGPETVGAEVGGRSALEPCPQAFDRVEFRGIRGQAMHGEPRGLGLDVRAGDEAAVRVQPVPEQENASPEMTTQVPEEAHDLGRADRPRIHHQEDAGVLGRARWVG